MEEQTFIAAQEKADPVACNGLIADHIVSGLGKLGATVSKRDAENIRAVLSAMMPLYTSPPAERVRMIDDLCRIGHLIATQDNRITDAPIFIVQEKRESVANPDYDHTRIAWVNDYGGEAGESERLELDAAFDVDGTEPDGWRRLAVTERWEFVTACFTEQGCKDYLVRNGHNLREPRIYAAGSYRNEEYRQVRNFLLSIAAEPTKHGHPA